MLARLRPRSAYDVMAALALFVALATGSAYAANTVFSSDIVDGEVKNADLAANSVASGKIADAQVKNADLGTGASSSNTIADGGVQGVDVADNSLKGVDIDESTLSGIGGGGPAGGDLKGTYPDPLIDVNAVGGEEVVDESLTGADVALQNGQTSFGENMTLVAGGNYLLTTPAVTADHDGKCLVTTMAQVDSTADNTSGGPFFRIAVERNGTNGDDAAYGYYFVEGTAGPLPSQTRTRLIDVTAGESLRFGAYVAGVSGSWVGDLLSASTSYVCL